MNKPLFRRPGPKQGSANAADFVRLPLDLLKDPGTREALDYWQRKRGTRPLPLIADFNPAELPRLLPNILAVDVKGPPWEFHYKIVGEAHKQASGMNMTGETTAALTRVNDDFRGQVEQLYNRICETKEPQALAGDLAWAGRSFYRFEGVYLPFARPDGEVGRIILVGVYYAHQSS